MIITFIFILIVTSIYVLQTLSHRNSENILKYTQLVHFKKDEYVSRVVKNTKEARHLLTAGFKYVRTALQEIMLFRKRK